MGPSLAFGDQGTITIVRSQTSILGKNQSYNLYLDERKAWGLGFLLIKTYPREVWNLGDKIDFW